MTLTARNYNTATAPLPGYLGKVRNYEQELRQAGVRADHRIWPTGAVGHELFAEGMTVAAHVGSPTRRPIDRLSALAELVCCLKAGLIRVGRHQ